MLAHIRSDQWLGNKEFWQTFCRTLLKDKTAAFKLLYNVNQPKLLIDRGLFSKAFRLDGWTLKEEVAPKAEAVKWAGKTYSIESCG